MSAIFDRQNDDVAMTYLQASKYCSRQKSLVTYFMITISLLVTVASIAVRMFNLTKAQSETATTIVVIISGVVLITNIFCSFLEYEFNIQGVNLLEWYDIYVFNLPSNKALMRPIGEQQIINYARKYSNRKKVARLKNYYFKTPEEAEQKSAFMKIKNEFAYDHRLLLNVHALFMVLWVGYVVLVIALAFTREITFRVAAVNIFVPALSTISLIAGSWRRYREQIRRVTNGVSVTTEMLSANNKKDPSAPSLQSPLVLRQLQDALFNHRANDFTIPVFLRRRFDKKLKREEELLKQEVMDKSDLPQTTTRTRKKIQNAPLPSDKAKAPRPAQGDSEPKAARPEQNDNAPNAVRAAPNSIRSVQNNSASKNTRAADKPKTAVADKPKATVADKPKTAVKAADNSKAPKANKPK